MKETKPKVPIQTRRKFDHAFKRDAVDLWLSSGKSAREIAAQLGIRENRLYLWKKRFAPATAAVQEDLQSEVLRLRRDNALLRQQRDILKKTLGILSEPPNNATNGSTP